MCRDAGKNSSALQNRIKAMDKDRVREKMKANCSKGYLDVQKEKLPKLEESHMLDKTVWEIVLSPQWRSLTAAQTPAGPGRSTALSPSPGFCVRSCRRCLAKPGRAVRGLRWARVGRSAGRSAGRLLCLLPVLC